MTLALGTVPAGTTLYIPFATYAGSTGASATLTGLAVTDIEIYKDGSTTQRASDAGYTLLDTDGIDFDGITGIHGFSVDLSDNTDSGFYAVGSVYWVVVSAVTVDSQTVNFIAAVFRIGPAEAVAGYPKVDAQYIEGVDATNQIRDAANAADTLQRLVTTIEAASGSPGEYRFTVDALRHVPAVVWGAERTNFAAAGSFGEYVLANVTFAAGTAWNSGAINASTLAADTITDAKVAADVTIASVTGAVGSVTGNVGGNVTGSIGSLAAQAKADVNAEADTALADVGVTSTVTGRIDTTISSRASAADLATVATYVDTEIATIITNLATVDGVVDAIKLLTDKLDTMLQAAGGSPGDYEFSVDALRNAPTGSGGGGSGSTDWTSDERSQIRHRLGIDGTAVAPSATPSLSTATALASVATTASATKVVTDKVDTMLEVAAGSPTDYRLSEDAVRNVANVVPTALQNADTLLDRDMAAGSDTGSSVKRTVRQALRILRNRWVITGSTQSIKKEDDSTESWTQELGTTAGADPVTSTDPAG